MSSGFFCWKAETIAHSFHETKGSNSDVSKMFWPANNIKNLPTISRTSSQQYQKSAQQPTISKICQQYQEPAANNVKNQPSNQWLPTNQ
jgi:hypothetical protein